MRLDKLKIREFKNLKEFEIDFDETSATTVLVGQNGTGKSNLIEALVIIFGDLDLGERPTFAYELSYICRGSTVRVDADPHRSQNSVRIFVDGEMISFQTFHKEKKYLPSNVFAYYSGPSNRLEKHFEKHQQRFYKALLRGEDKPLRPLFYARLIHSQFVLLSFFADKDHRSRQFLNEIFGIEGLESVLFILNEPPWKSKAGDPRFWLAKGTVANFLDRMYSFALAPLRITKKIPKGDKPNEYLYLFIKDLATLHRFVSEYESESALFKGLESTYISQLIFEVRIRVKIRGLDGYLTFKLNSCTIRSVASRPAETTLLAKSRMARNKCLQSASSAAIGGMEPRGERPCPGLQTFPNNSPKRWRRTAVFSVLRLSGISKPMSAG